MRYQVRYDNMDRIVFNTDSYVQGCKVAFAFQDMDRFNNEHVILVDNETGRACSQVLREEDYAQ